MNKPEEIKQILDEHKVIAVVGLSSNPIRPSHGVAKYMQRHGYNIIPVNPMETEVLGETCYAKLTDIPQKVDLVNIFRRSEEAGKIVDEAIEIGAKSVWLQEGVIDEEAVNRAESAGLVAVMDLCWLKEYSRFNSKK
jgi:uncharacterized protein